MTTEKFIVAVTGETIAEVQMTRNEFDDESIEITTVSGKRFSLEPEALAKRNDIGYDAWITIRQLEGSEHGTPVEVS